MTSCFLKAASQAIAFYSTQTARAIRTEDDDLDTTRQKLALIPDLPYSKDNAIASYCSKYWIIRRQFLSKRLRPLVSRVLLTGNQGVPEMIKTHGGRSRAFAWRVRGTTLVIQSESGMHHEYSLHEVFSIVQVLRATFSGNWFPLGNNVERLYAGTEKEGLGRTIYAHRPGDTVHAQGASYLGVVLEQAGLLEWNGKKSGIAWRFRQDIDDVESLHELLKRSAREDR